MKYILLFAVASLVTGLSSCETVVVQPVKHHTVKKRYPSTSVSHSPESFDHVPGIR